MKSGFLLYASSAAAMGGLLFGYDTAVIAGTVDYLQKHFQLDALALGWTVSSALVGCIIGAGAAGSMGDRMGRKGALLLCAVLFLHPPSGRDWLPRPSSWFSPESSAGWEWGRLPCWFPFTSLKSRRPGLAGP